MKKLLGFVLVLSLVAMPAMAQKITIDYSHDFDFAAVKTFQYVETKDTQPVNPMMADRLVAKIKAELKEGGLTEVEENPDLYVTVHYASKDNTVYNTTSYGYGGYHGGFYRWGGAGMGGSATTTASTYTEGTLVFDAYDSSEKKMVWRGTGTVTVKKKPEGQIKQMDKILKKLGDKWDKILKNKGK
jgi:hypothetical protein